MTHRRRILAPTFRLFAVVTTPLVNAPSSANLGDVIEVNQTTITSSMLFPAKPPFQPIVFSESPPVFAKPVAAAQQRFQDFVPVGYAPTTGPMRFIESPPQTIAPVVSIAKQQFGQDLAIKPPPAFTIQGLSQSPDLFAKPFNVALQKIREDQPPFVVTPLINAVASAPASEIIEVNATTIASGMSFPGAPTATGTPGPLQGINPYPEQFAKPILAALQRFPDLAPFGYAATTGPLVFSQAPEQFAKPYAVSLQRIPDLAPFGYAATTGPLTFAQSPDRFKQPYQDQRWPDFTPQGTIVSVTPQGGYYEGLSFRFACPVIDKQFGPFVVPAAFRPVTFIQWPERFAATYPATQQQASAFPVIVGAATPSAFGFSQSIERFATFYPATQQLCSASFGFNPGAATQTPTTTGFDPTVPPVFVVPPNAAQQMMSAWGNFIPPAVTAMFTVSGSEVKDRFPTTSVSYGYEIPFGVSSNISRRTN